MAPILSICIPTYNRAGQIEQCLKSIVSQDLFMSSDKVEIVISDNCSTDETEKIVKKFVNEHPSKIKYVKTNKNIGFDNFEYVLKHGSGDFLKLYNDYLILKNGELDYIVNVIEKNKKERPVLFFSNENKNDVRVGNLDEFITQISFFNTWIASFGIWKSDFEKYDNLFRCNETSLPQTDILCRIITDGRSAVIINKRIFDSVCVSKKGGYNIAEVFGYNYLNILKRFIQDGGLSESVYKKEKKKILLDHINFYYFDIKKQFTFKKTGYFKWLMPDYKYNLYFYIAYIKTMLRVFIKSVERLLCKSYRHE